MDKKDLRIFVKNLLKEMPPAFFRSKSREIAHHLKKFIEEYFGNRKLIVAGYCSLDEEVNTWDLLEEWMARGHEIYLPAIDGSQLRFRRLSSLQSLVKGRWGIFEPPQFSEELNSKPDFIILPGICFDRKGNRLGRGMGYYDRFLKRMGNESLKIGLSFDFQLFERIPAREEDCKVDVIITEREIIRNNLTGG